MGRLYVGHAKYVLHRLFEAEKAFGAGIRLVAEHHGAPLILAHSACATVGDAVDINIARAQTERVVSGLLQIFPPLFLCRLADWLNYLDSERFGNVFHNAASIHI